MPLPFLGAALGVASFLTRPRGKRPNIGGAIRRYENAGPNASDIAFGERQLGRTNELIGQGQQEATAGVARRFRARGLGGPAEDQAIGEVAQAGAQARVNAGRDVTDALDRRVQSRAANVFNAEVGQARTDAQGYDAQHAAYWNSIGEMLPALMGAGGNPSVPSTPISAPQKPLIDELGSDYYPR